MNVQRACTPCVLSVSHVRTMHEVRECTSSGGVFTILASLTPLFRFSPLASFKRVCNDAPLCESGKTWNAATGKAPCGACSSSASCSNGVETACTGTTNTVCKTACAGGTTWSSDGLSPCSTCTAESSCAPHGVDAACTASSDTVCTPPVPCVSGSTFSTWQVTLPVVRGSKHVPKRSEARVCSDDQHHVCPRANTDRPLAQNRQCRVCGSPAKRRHQSPRAIANQRRSAGRSDFDGAELRWCCVGTVSRKPYAFQFCKRGVYVHLGEVVSRRSGYIY